MKVSLEFERAVWSQLTPRSLSVKFWASLTFGSFDWWEITKNNHLRNWAVVEFWAFHFTMVSFAVIAFENLKLIKHMLWFVSHFTKILKVAMWFLENLKYFQHIHIINHGVLQWFYIKFYWPLAVVQKTQVEKLWLLIFVRFQYINYCSIEITVWQFCAISHFPIFQYQ